ncbi:MULTISPECIES: hypothetical protein [unclassified Kribbella]|uniref:hypothetical protein n=1 Tax=unclassified Kribbella TaxID=2644121 RepID=UPI0030173DFB
MRRRAVVEYVLSNCSIPWRGRRWFRPGNPKFERVQVFAVDEAGRLVGGKDL